MAGAVGGEVVCLCKFERYGNHGGRARLVKKFYVKRLRFCDARRKEGASLPPASWAYAYIQQAVFYQECIREKTSVYFC